MVKLKPDVYSIMSLDDNGDKINRGCFVISRYGGLIWKVLDRRADLILCIPSSAEPNLYETEWPDRWMFDTHGEMMFYGNVERSDGYGETEIGI